MRTHSLILLPFFLLSCSPTLLVKRGIPEFSAPQNQALCIILSVDGNFDEFVPVFVDGKIHSALQDKSVTSFPVEPGLHYLTAQLDNQATKRLNFQAGKMYFLKMGTLEVPLFDGVRLELIDMTTAQKLLQVYADTLVYTTLDPQVPYENMDSDDYTEETQEYQEWAASNGAEAKMEVEYPGY